MAFVDMNMCPTEGGVLVHAILFALVIYFGKQLYEKHYGNGVNKVIVNKVNNVNNLDNQIRSKCKTYCENITNEMRNNNNHNNKNNLQLPNNLPINNIPQPPELFKLLISVD